MNDTTKQSVLFDELANRPITVSFDQPDASSDGGLLLLKACDERLGLTAKMGECIRDERQQEKISHSVADLLRQRVFSLAAGYEDCNDATRLAKDPMQRMVLDRDPVTGATLASQPTLSRFENQLDGRSLVRMGHALADTVIEHHARRLNGRARRVTIDLDPTDDPVYGGQQLSFFNGYYGQWCYLPVACFLQFDDEVDQYLYSVILRPGDVKAHEGATAILRRTVKKLREHFGKSLTIRVRLDGGFTCEEVLSCLEELGVEYVMALAKNCVLQAEVAPLMNEVQWLAAQSGESERRYTECQYQAGSWHDERRVVCKAEVTWHPGREPRDNPRFVVTNLSTSPKHVYAEVYCQRAQIENRIKELLYGLQIDRTSCTRFLANQCRVLMTAAAYVLFQELRLQAQGTSLQQAQVTTLRERLLKLGAWVQRSTRRIVIHLPANAPWADDWCKIATRLGAVPP